MNTIFKSFFILLVLIAGCNNAKQELGQTLIEAQFNVDSSLLADSLIIDSTLNYSIKHPIRWKPISADLASRLKSGMLSSQYATAAIKSGCYNPKDTSLMIVLDISKMDTSFFTSLKEKYRDELNVNGIWNSLQFQEFIHNSFRIEQYVLQNSEILNFKLIVYNYLKDSIPPPKLELLYFINQNYLSENISLVESSIGSLNIINP